MSVGRFQPWPSGCPSTPRGSVGPPPAPRNARSPLCRMPLAAVGYLDGTLAIYDLSTQTLRHKCQHEVLPYTLFRGLRLSRRAQGLSWLAEGWFLLCASPLALGFPLRQLLCPQGMCLRPSPLCLWGHGGADPAASLLPCRSQGSCSCCGRRARPWCTPAAWTGPCGSGTPARGS